MAVSYRLVTGPGNWPQPFMGVIDLGAPKLHDYGDNEFGVRYRVAGSFSVGGVTYKIKGTIPVHDQGAGLWDGLFRIPLWVSDEHRYDWESATGKFFTADGAPYPSARGTSSIAYSIHPERIDFEGSAFLSGSGLGAGTLIAVRSCVSAGLDENRLKASGEPTIVDVQ